MSRTCFWIFLVCLPNCGGDYWKNAEVELTFNMSDGSTHRLSSKGIFTQGGITDNWYIQVLPDNAGYSFDIHFDPQLIDAPGSYDIPASDAISGGMGWPDSDGDTDFGSHESGLVQIDSVGFSLGDTLRGSFDQIIVDAWDEDDPNPCLSLSDGSFEATNEGPDAF